MESINDQLRAAARDGDTAKLKTLLLDPKSDALSEDKYGMTALMAAASSGHESCLELLLPVSAPLVKDRQSETALMRAVANGNTSCVKILLTSK